MNAQDLKNSILQLAVQGKLVKQRPEEGIAEELYAEIQAEKTRLMLEKKIKKAKSLPEIGEDEMPFEIPNNWKFVRLENITYNIGGKANQIKQSEVLIEGKVPVVSQSMNKIEGYTNDISKILSNPGKVIIFGDHSKTLKLINFDFVIGADGTKILVPVKIYPEFLYYVLEYNIISIKDRGYSRHFQFLNNKFIPLPPLSEQKRIVAKIEELMPYVEKYGQVDTKLELLNTNFPKDMKNSILQYAVQGKLVAQRLEEGTASDLYKKIQIEKDRLITEGKIKKEKVLAEVTEEEIPYDIPSTWKWVRLGEIGYWGAGATPSRSNPKFYNGDIPWLKTGDLNDGMINEVSETITSLALEKTSVRLNPPGSVLMAMYGATIGKLGILNIHATTNQACCACSVYEGVDNMYLFYYLMSQRRNYINLGTGGAQPNISKVKIINAIFPLPPLGEQKRIVAMIEELMNHI